MAGDEGVAEGTSEKTGREGGRKHFRYSISHWTYPSAAKHISSIQMSVGRLILLVMRVTDMNDTAEVPHHSKDRPAEVKN